MQKYSDVVLVTDVPGGQVRAPASATVQVNVSGGAAATIYSDDGVTPQTNPITADLSGEYSFYAADGLYDLVISVPGFTNETKTAAVLLFDSLASSGSASVGFIASGTGAVARTAQAKMRDIASRADFNTLGNYQTAQAALSGTVGVPTLQVASFLDIQDGSAANPALRFLAHQGTGFAYIHNNSLSIVTNNAEALWVNGGGQVVSNIDGTAAVPQYTFNKDAGSGFFMEVADVLCMAAGTRKVMQFSQPSVADATSSNGWAQFYGGGSCYTKTKGYTQTSIAGAAKTIAVLDEFACFILVAGNDGSNFFFDLVMGMFGSTPVAKESFTQGAPSARTYSINASQNMQLVMAAGTYDTNTYSIQLKDR